MTPYWFVANLAAMFVFGLIVAYFTSHCGAHHGGHIVIQKRNAIAQIRRRALQWPVLLGFCVLIAVAAQDRSTANPEPSAPPHDGRADFDWDIGTWQTHQKRLLHPLTGSTTWVEYQGTDVVEKLWDGANVGHIRANGSAGQLEIFTVRLYNPQTHEWSIYFSTAGNGTFGTPVVGTFKAGRGEFIDQEPYNGRTILVRFSVFDITADSCRFEQAFSGDGGRSWETNFIVTETRAEQKPANGGRR